MRHENVGSLLELHATQSPDKEFLVSEADGRAFTYSEFDRAVNEAAELLYGRGVRKGGRVSLFLTNSAEYFILYFACFKLGAWAGPVNALLKPEEVAFIVNDSESIVAVTQPDLYSTLRLARSHTPGLRDVLVVDGPITTGNRGPAEEVSRARPSGSPDPHTGTGTAVERPTPEDEAIIIYTSGTTGKPKGVLLTHGNLLSNAEHIAAWLRLGQADRALMIMPLFHVNALMTTGLAALWAGASIVLSPRFSASRHWDIVSRYGVTYFGSVATMLSLLNHAYPDGIPEGLDVSRLRFALCGSAPVPVEVMRRFEQIFHCPVIEGYGLSESTCRSTFNPIDGNRRPGSVGLPIGNEMKVFDEQDREAGAGEIGEIVMRGPNLMKGYYRNEAATADAFRAGWFHTGDLGYRDEDGYFYVVDRKGDMIIRAGENIYPREIDEVLYRHPKVKDAAAVGVPDPLYGEEVKAFIVLREGEQASGQEIIDFCREQLADYKCPKAVEFLEEIPKGPTGKLLKRELSRR